MLGAAGKTIGQRMSYAQLAGIVATGLAGLAGEHLAKGRKTDPRMTDIATIGGFALGAAGLMTGNAAISAAGAFGVGFGLQRGEEEIKTKTRSDDSLTAVVQEVIREELRKIPGRASREIKKIGGNL